MDSGDSNVDLFAQQSETEIDNPIPINCSDFEEPSPRLYQKERANETADESNDEKSAMQGDEEAY